METVHKFKAHDGKLFDDVEECLWYEEMIGAVKEAIRLILPEEHDTVAFSNGHGYIQLTAATKTVFITMYLGAVERFLPDLLPLAKGNPTGIVGRYLCDGDSPIYKLFLLADRIDSQNRLWGQSYYAKNPGAGDLVMLAER